MKVVSDEAKKEIKKQIEEMKSEINKNIDEVRYEMSKVLDEIKKDNRNIKEEIDLIKEYVQKIFKFVIDVRYNIKLF